MAEFDYTAYVYLREDVPLTLELWASLSKGADDSIKIGNGGESFVHAGGRGVGVLSVPCTFTPEGRALTVTQQMFWPHIISDLDEHTCHFVVTSVGETVSGHADAKAVVNSVLRVAARLARHPQAIGVHWLGSGLCFPKAMFLEMMEASPDRPPSNIVLHPKWYGNPAPDGQGISAETRGMAALLLPDVWHGHTGEDHETVCRRVYAIAEYLIEHGPIIRDGETIGDGNKRPMKAMVRQAGGQDYIALGYDDLFIEPPNDRRGRAGRLFDRLRRGA